MKGPEEVSPATRRRIVVSDETGSSWRTIQGRKLENPIGEQPVEVQKVSEVSRTRFPIRLPVLIIGLSAFIVLAVLGIVLIFRPGPAMPAPAPQAQSQNPFEVPPRVVSQEPEELRRIEEGAKQVLRSISRDNKPYSFSEKTIGDIQAKVLELKGLSCLADSLSNLQANAGSLGSQADKVGLQASLVMLLGMALSNGCESGSASTAAAKALPSLASLNRTFGSTEADSCLILIAAFHEGTGTQRSHPLLRRMNKAVTNPLTERNVWYLNEHQVISSEAYELVVDTIACGIIARNPRQFGVQTDPLSF